MTAVLNSPRCALMNAYVPLTPLRFAPIAHWSSLVLTILLKVSVKAWAVHYKMFRPCD